MSIRRSLTAGLVLALFVVACSQTASPTAPSPNTGTLASPASSAPLSATSVDFVTDSDGNGTAFRLTGFDGVELQGTNNQGSFTAVFDAGTVFRNAHLSQFAPVDPCRDLPANCNAAGTSGDTGDTGLRTALAELATSGCVARVLVDKGSDVAVPPNPTHPIKGFRPLPSL